MENETLKVEKQPRPDKEEQNLKVGKEPLRCKQKPHKVEKTSPDRYGGTKTFRWGKQTFEVEQKTLPSSTWDHNGF